MEFSEILKILREKNGYTQKDLGTLINLSEQAVSHYENNTNSPNIDTIIKIANIFDVSIDYLLGRSANDAPYSRLVQKFGGITVDELIARLLSLDQKHRADALTAITYIQSHNKIYGKNNK